MASGFSLDEPAATNIRTFLSLERSCKNSPLVCVGVPTRVRVSGPTEIYKSGP